MKIKKFEFPSFEEFYALRTSGLFNWEVKSTIGNFTAKITTSSYSIDTGSRIFISHIVDSIFGIELIHQSYYNWKVIHGSGTDDLKAWYEKAIKELNNIFEKYIIETYIEEN